MWLMVDPEIIKGQCDMLSCLGTGCAGNVPNRLISISQILKQESSATSRNCNLLQIHRLEAEGDDSSALIRSGVGHAKQFCPVGRHPPFIVCFPQPIASKTTPFRRRLHVQMSCSTKAY